MGALLSEAMDVGACGFSAQNMGEDSVQRDYDGTPMITDIMAADDLLHFARVLGEKGRGFIQLLGGDFDLYEKVAEVSGRPVIWNNLEFAHDQHGNTYGFLPGHPGVAGAGERAGTSALRARGHLRHRFPFLAGGLQPVRRDEGLARPHPGQRGRSAWPRCATPCCAMRSGPSSTASRPDGTGIPTKPVPPYLYVPEMRIAEARSEAVRPLEGYTVGEVAERENKHPIDAFLDVALSEDPRDVLHVPGAGDLGRRPARGDQLPVRPPGGFRRRRSHEVRDGPDATRPISSGGSCATWGLMDLEQAHWRLVRLLGHGRRLHRPGLPAGRRARGRHRLRLRRAALAPAGAHPRLPGRPTGASRRRPRATA